MDSEQPIIIIKKKGGHGGHHGGAWKVAYADFVTAMMALFIVLWLLSSTSKQTQEEIAGYFNDPKGLSTKKGGNGKVSSKETKEQNQDMAELKKDLQHAIDNINALNKLKKQIEMTVTDEGLRIEMIEEEKGTFFESGSAQPTPAMVEVLKVLAGQLKDLPNCISIEGHTDAQPYTSRTNYGNWELSSDRANVARREMQADGVRLNQVSQVRGFADQRLHYPDKPFDASNRRVSLVVQNLPKNAAPTPNKLATAESGVKNELAAATETPGAPAAPAPTASASTKEAGSSAMAVAPSMAGKASAGLLDRAKGLFHKN